MDFPNVSKGLLDKMRGLMVHFPTNPLVITGMEMIEQQSMDVQTRIVRVGNDLRNMQQLLEGKMQK